jgi:hypothetical protein
MSSLKIKNADFKIIMDYALASCMDNEGMAFKIKDGYVEISHINATHGALYYLKFNVETDITEYKVNVLVKDMKDVKDLVGDSDVDFSFDKDNRLSVKFGKIKKKIPQMADVDCCTRIPKVPLTTKIAFTDIHKKDILKFLKDAHNISAATITLISNAGGLVIVAEDDTVLRNSEIEYFPDEFEEFSSTVDAATIFGMEYFEPVIKNKIEGSKAFIEFGHDLPLRLVQEFDNGIGLFLVGPRK